MDRKGVGVGVRVGVLGRCMKPCEGGTGGGGEYGGCDARGDTCVVVWPNTEGKGVSPLRCT